MPVETFSPGATIRLWVRPITEQFVTQDLFDQFAEELKRLNRYGFQLQMNKARTTQGRVYHRVTLNCEGEAPVEEILSEGEFRCVALAEFLTELAAASQ